MTQLQETKVKAVVMEVDVEEIITLPVAAMWAMGTATVEEENVIVIAAAAVVMEGVIVVAVDCKLSNLWTIMLRLSLYHIT